MLSAPAISDYAWRVRSLLPGILSVLYEAAGLHGGSPVRTRRHRSEFIKPVITPQRRPSGNRPASQAPVTPPVLDCAPNAAAISPLFLSPLRVNTGKISINIECGYRLILISISTAAYPLSPLILRNGYSRTPKRLPFFLLPRAGQCSQLCSWHNSHSLPFISG